MRGISNAVVFANPPFFWDTLYFSLTAMGKLGGSRGKWGAVLSGKSYVYGIYFSLNTGGINGALD